MSSGCKFGLIGHKIGYSKSPDIFASIFSRMNIDGSFESFDFPPEKLEQVFQHLTESEISGLSVTIPYKSAIQDYLTSLDKSAQIVGAVNSIKLKGGKSLGYNTDTYGFSLGLEGHRELVTGNSATILGCGGAASAAVYSLYSDFGVRQFQIYGRNQNRLGLFVERMKAQLVGCEFETTDLMTTETVQAAPAIVVNCTPLGGGSFPKENPLPQSLNWQEVRVYYDLNYNSDSPAIVVAKSKGAITLDGRKMLVGQAVRSFKIWTGHEADMGPVFEDVFGKE